MAHKVIVATAVAANTPFVVTVPGQEKWRLIAVCATLSRAVGGTPTRSLKLTVTNGTDLLAASPADDAGTEPGTLTATWANAQPASSSSGGTGTTLGSIANLPLLPGYVITGTVISGAATDQWTRAVVWVDYVLSG